MKDLNRYVINKYAMYWRDIGFELDLEHSKIDIIETNYSECEKRFYEVLKAWLQLDKNISWKALEVAIMNAKILKGGGNLIDYVDGKDVLRLNFVCMIIIMYRISLSNSASLISTKL